MALGINLDPEDDWEFLARKERQLWDDETDNQGKPTCSGDGVIKTEQLRQWVRDEFARRTKAVEEGTVSPRDIVWLNPEYRVQFSEVATKAEELGLDYDALELRHIVAGVLG